MDSRDIYKKAIINYKEGSFLCPFQNRVCEECSFYDKNMESASACVLHWDDGNRNEVALKNLIKLFPLQFLEEGT